jgi:hypothetical protein
MSGRATEHEDIEVPFAARAAYTKVAALTRNVVTGLGCISNQ